MPSRVRVLVLCLGLAAAAAAQAPTFSIPPGFLTKPSATYQWAGWNRTNARAQHLYNSKSAGTDKTFRLIRGLWVRGHFDTAKPHRTEVAITMSTGGVNWAAPSAKSWSANEGSSKRLFLPRTKINFPGYSTRVVPKPWSVELKGTVPFLVPTGQGLCIDFKFWGPSVFPHEWHADADYGPKVRADDFGSVQSYGTRCLWILEGANGTHVGSGRELEVFGVTGWAGDLAISWLGLKKLALRIPGTNCFMHTEPLLLHPSIVRAQLFGRVEFRWMEVQPAQVGLAFRSQILALGPLGQLKASKGLDIRLGAGASPIAHSSVFAFTQGAVQFDPDKDPPQSYWRSAVVLGGY